MFWFANIYIENNFFIIPTISRNTYVTEKYSHVRRAINRHISSAIIITRNEWAEKTRARNQTTDREITRLGISGTSQIRFSLLSKVAERRATVVFHLFQFPDTSEPWRTCYFAAAVQFSIVPSTVQRNVSKRLERSSRGVCSKGHCSARETSVRVILLNLIWPAQRHHNHAPFSFSLLFWALAFFSTRFVNRWKCCWLYIRVYISTIASSYYDIHLQLDIGYREIRIKR